MQTVFKNKSENQLAFRRYSNKLSEYNLNSEKPLEIGFGAQDYFHGGLSDLKVYRGALSALQIEQLAKPVQP